MTQNEPYKYVMAIFENDPKSPCIQICKLDQVTMLCRGCYRTLTEIVSWRKATAPMKRLILQDVAERKKAEDNLPPIVIVAEMSLEFS